ncbi:MAG: hypothetical protein C0631_03890 [Sedimenticola sp.]|nr:MAG: hypothetical protein C0631_03890 [Sedimenticola sp.]
MLARTFLLASLATLFLATQAEAKMYRWVDESGTTVYSQTPPIDGNASEVTVTPAPSSAPAAPQTPEPQQSAAPEEATPEAAVDDEAEMARKKAASDKIKAESCAAAKHNLSVYQNAGNKLIKTPEGLYERLTDEQREERIKQAEENVKEFCSE